MSSLPASLSRYFDVSPFGIQATLLEPGAVSSGALDDVTTFTLPDNPYATLLAPDRRPKMTPQEVADGVADGVADAVEIEPLPLRIPLGTAAAILTARRAAPDDRPFVP